MATIEREVQALRREVRQVIDLLKASKPPETWITGQELVRLTTLTPKQISRLGSIVSKDVPGKRKRYLLESVPHYYFKPQPEVHGKN